MSTNSSQKSVKHDVKMFKKYRNLLGELTRKNIKLKYRNSWLGIFWSFLQPLLNMIVLSVVFTGLFGKSNKHVICYPVFLFAGRLVYDFFSTATKQAMTSFRRNAAIIKKVYVPKYMYPLSSIFSTFVTFAISLLCYICVWIFFKATGISNGSHLHLTWNVFAFFIPMIQVLLFSTGIGLILSVLEVYFRDIEYIWDVFVRLTFYLVPILYPLQRIKSSHHLVMLVKINPLYSIVTLFRNAVLYGKTIDLELFIYGTACSLIVLIIGILVFNWKSDDIVFHL